MEFRKHTLANGLEIVAETNDEAHSTALAYFVRTGARDETDDVAGVSHFLEHMVFKGTARRTADDVNREFDELGAHYNAFTNEEQTVYYASVLPEYQAATIDLLSDIVRPALRDEDFQTERQVILEEIQMYEDQPPFLGDEKCRAAHYGRHPLGRSVLGTIDSISNLRVDAMRDYFRRRYAPSNMTLVAAGRIDFDALVKSAEATCGRWESLTAPRELPPLESHPGFHVLHKESATQEYTLALADGPAATDPDRFAAKLLATVLGDDSGSRLYWELVDPGLAEQASLSHSDYEGAGLFSIYMCCEPHRTAENLKLINDILRKAEQEGVTEAELAQAKSKVSSRVVLSSERPRGRLFYVGYNWVHRREYRSVRKDLDAVAAITVDEIAAVLKKYPLTRTTTLIAGPLEDLATIRNS